MIQPLERTELTTPARCALKAKSLRAACAALLAFGLMSVMGPCVQAQGAEPGLEEPFSYPASLLRARSTYTVSPATPVLLGSTVVVLEQSRLTDVAAIAHAPVHVEGSGRSARRWVCAQAQGATRPVKLWFIATGQETVTEVQMRPGTFAETAGCGELTNHFEPVTLSRIASGMTVDSVVRDIGPASARDARGWHFWVSRRSYEYYEQKFTEYVWVGALADEKGVISDVFTTQITR